MNQEMEQKEECDWSENRDCRKEEELLPSGSNVEEGEDAMEIWEQGVGTVGKRITKSWTFGLNSCRVGIPFGINKFNVLSVKI